MKATIAVVDRDLEVIQCPEFTTKNHRNRIRTLYNNSRSVSFGAGPADRLGSYLNHLQSFIKNFVEAHCTISLNATLVLTRLLPLDLGIYAAFALYEDKTGISEPLLGDRQIKWKFRPYETSK